MQFQMRKLKNGIHRNREQVKELSAGRILSELSVTLSCINVFR